MGQTDHVFLADVASFVEMDSIIETRFERNVGVVHVDPEPGPSGLDAPGLRDFEIGRRNAAVERSIQERPNRRRGTGDVVSGARTRQD